MQPSERSTSCGCHIVAVVFHALTAIFPHFLSSAVQMGYYLDPYVPILAKASISASSPTSSHLTPFDTSSVSSSSSATSTGWEVNESPGASRSAHHIQPPLINRGYYARVAAIRASLASFLSSHHGSQIVSFGAGFDSTYFMLKVRSLLPLTSALYAHSWPTEGASLRFNQLHALTSLNDPCGAYSQRMKDTILIDTLKSMWQTPC